MTLASLHLARLRKHLHYIHREDADPFVNTKRIESIMLNTKKFNIVQTNVLNTIVGETLPGVTAEKLDAPVQRPFYYKSACSRGYFLNSSDGTGKIYYPCHTVSFEDTEA